MYRYITFAWNPRHQTAAHAARALVSRSKTFTTSSWSCILDTDGLFIASAGARANGFRSEPLPEGAGAILGSVFERPDRSEYAYPTQAAKLSGSTGDELIKSEGRLLVRDYWGSYIAFLRDRACHRQWILPSPMCSLPCFYTVHDGVYVFFSRMEDCLALDAIRFSYNWQCVAAHVIFDGIGASETAIDGVFELKPGECLALLAESTNRSVYWHPGDFVNADTILDREEASREVRKTAKYCVHTWAACHASIVHKLSGGVDSSIVAACLQDAPTRPTVTCTTDYSDGANGDERYYARLSAARSGFPLLERQRSVVLRDMLRARRTATLYGYFMELVNARPAVSVAKELGATAVFTGTLGDVIFNRDPPLPSAADYLVTRGFRKGFLGAVYAAAQLERVSFWRAAHYAIREAIRSRRRSYWSFHRELRSEWPGKSIVNADLAESFMTGDEYVHPWFRSSHDIPPGKMWQIFAMAFGAFDNPFSEPEDPDVVHPLSSQPLVELCLRIPTYVHLDGGWDRAVARFAFVGDMPIQILTRTSKGGLEEFVKQAIRSDLSFVRECLLDGVLVREKLLDRTLLEQALSCSPTGSSIRPGEIIDYLSTEIWLMKWQQMQIRNAA